MAFHDASSPLPGSPRSMVRVVLGGPGLDGFEMPDATDAYVNLAIPPAGAPYDAPFEPAVREAHAGRCGRSGAATPCAPGTRRPARLTLDFVVHGDDGVAGPWAAPVAPGDVLVFEGPGSGYRPDPAADWHLLVGDESALPAIAASLEAVPAGRGSWSGWSATARSTSCRSTRPATRPPVAAPHRRRRADAELLADAVAARGLPGRASARVRARRGRGDPGDPPSPPRRARADPPRHVVLAVLAPHHDRRGLAPGQARLRGRHGGGRRLTTTVSPSRTGGAQVGPRGRSGRPPMLCP